MAMDPALAAALRELLALQPVAALATLHRGEPAASMVPYALLPGGQGFAIHVSRLATHTADLLAHPAVGLLVAAPPGHAPTPHELPRVSVQGEARPCPAGDALHDAARAAYLARFPDSEPMFGFGDFTLVVVTPRAIRFVGGFARATSILAEEFAAVLRGER